VREAIFLAPQTDHLAHSAAGLTIRASVQSVQASGSAVLSWPPSRTTGVTFQPEPTRTATATVQMLADQSLRDFRATWAMHFSIRRPNRVAKLSRYSGPVARLSETAFRARALCSSHPTAHPTPAPTPLKRCTITALRPAESALRQRSMVDAFASRLRASNT
jgi:hypothetical protein